MASLGAVLSRDGGTTATGRPVKFHLWQEADDGSARNVEVDTVMYPVDPEVASAAEREAIEYARAIGDTIGLRQEFKLRFLVAAMRDPEQPKVRLVLAKELHLFRRGSTDQLLEALEREYLTLVRTEYPETVTTKDFNAMVTEAGNFIDDGQTGSGPS